MVRRAAALLGCALLSFALPGPSAARRPPRGPDSDHDGFPARTRDAATRDCDDGNPAVYPGAPQIPDGLNNDCRHPSWPGLAGTNEGDDDGDGWSEVAGDCNDADAAFSPEAVEPCDGFDHDCSGQIDDGPDCPTSCEGAELADWTRITSDRSRSASPSLAWNGQNFALAWSDERTGKFGGEIFASRATARGIELGDDRRVSFEDGPSFGPSLAWNGTEFGLAWYVPFVQLRFDRLDVAGQVVGSSRPVGAAQKGQGGALAWGGESYALAWVEASLVGGAKVAVTRLSAAGTVLGTTRFGLKAALGAVDAPRIAAAPGGWGVVWSDQRHGNPEVYFARLDAAGNALAKELRLTNDPGDSSTPRVLWDGEGFGVFWSDDRRGLPELYFAAVGADGVEIVEDRPLDVPADAGIAWTGSEYVLVWQDTSGDLWLARHDVDGASLGLAQLLGQLPAAQPGVGLLRNERGLAWTGDGLGLSWVSAQAGNDEIYLARIDCPELEEFPDDFLSLTFNQLHENELLRQQDVLRLAGDSGALSVAAGFLPEPTGLAGLDVQRSGDMLFSVEQGGLLQHAGGSILVHDTGVYRWEAATGVVTEALSWGSVTGVRELAGIDLLADGTLAFAIAESQVIQHAGGSLGLVPGDVYRLDPATDTVSLFLGGADLGLGEIDALDVYPGLDRFAFSTATDRTITTGSGTTQLSHRNVYACTPGTGKIELVLDGQTLGLLSLDAVTLGAAME